jgi:hypothetical protein
MYGKIEVKAIGSHILQSAVIGQWDARFQPGAARIDPHTKNKQWSQWKCWGRHRTWFRSFRKSLAKSHNKVVELICNM